MLNRGAQPDGSRLASYIDRINKSARVQQSRSGRSQLEYSTGPSTCGRDRAHNRRNSAEHPVVSSRCGAMFSRAPARAMPSTRYSFMLANPA